MGFSLNNSSSRLGKEGETEWWEWTAFIEATLPNSLTEIDYVEYHLHPSFTNPIRRVKNPEGGFALTLTGWGIFELIAKVVFLSKEEKILRHVLEFDFSET